MVRKTCIEKQGLMMNSVRFKQVFMITPENQTRSMNSMDAAIIEDEL